MEVDDVTEVVDVDAGETTHLNEGGTLLGKYKYWSTRALMVDKDGTKNLDRSTVGSKVYPVFAITNPLREIDLVNGIPEDAGSNSFASEIQYYNVGPARLTAYKTERGGVGFYDIYNYKVDGHRSTYTLEQVRKKFVFIPGQGVVVKPPGYDVEYTDDQPDIGGSQVVVPKTPNVLWNILLLVGIILAPVIIQENYNL